MPKLAFFRSAPLAAAAVIAAGLAAPAAMAQPIPEVEPNNTPALANFIGSFDAPGGSVLIEGFITPGNPQQNLPGDVDVFSFTITGPTNFLASVFGIPSSGTGNSQLVLFDGMGTIYAADDDSGLGEFSALEAVLAPGTYFIALTGSNDVGFPGLPTIPDGFQPDGSPHMQDFQYKLMIGLSVIPSPSAAAVLALGGVAAARRRRR